MNKITVVFENAGSENKSLKTGHGLSFFIETDNTRILFDFGQDNNMVYNAKKLGIDFEKISYAVLSHNHYDHATGYIDAVKAGLKAPLVTGNNFFDSKYAFDGQKFTVLHSPITEEFLNNNNISRTICTNMLKLAEGCYVVGDFERTETCETIPSRLVKSTSTPPEPDTFADEVCLVLDSEKGLIVIVGCSHPGILNILTTVSKRLNKNIYAVLGGTHLVEANAERMEYTIQKMSSLGVSLFGLNHCTGDEALRVLKKHGVEKAALNTGDVLSI